MTQRVRLSSTGVPAGSVVSSIARLQHAFLTDRYSGSERTVALAREAFAVSLASGNEAAMASTRFALWQLGGPEADAALTDALQRAEAIGDLVLQARSLTYLATAARQRGDLTDARRWLDRVQPIATTA